MSEIFYVYFLQSCRNNKVYVGSTSKKPLDRLNEHNKSSNIWTKNNGPFKLVYYEKCACQIDAKKRELFYKSGFGKQIKNLIVQYITSHSIKVMVK